MVSERSIFSENRIIKVFPCRGEPACTYISGSRCAWWQKTMNRQKTDTHMGQLHNPHCSCMPRVNKRFTYCISTGSPEPGNISCELSTAPLTLGISYMYVTSGTDPGNELCMYITRAQAALTLG